MAPFVSPSKRGKLRLMNTLCMPRRSTNVSILCLILSLSFASTGWSKVEYDSDSLRMKNAEQLNALVLKKIKKAEDIQKKQDVDDDLGIVAEPDAIEALQEALMIVLARPDQEGARANAFARVRRELTDLNSFDQVIKDVVKESINGLKEKSTPVREQATYIVILDNLMAEIKPDVGSNALFKKLVEDIRDAKIEISDKVRSQQLLRSMTRPVSPSKTAETILPKKK